jgi:hypothetical protein
VFEIWKDELKNLYNLLVGVWEIEENGFEPV